MNEPWICAACAVEYPGDTEPPEVCPICADERQYVPDGGQRWTTAPELRDAGNRVQVRELAPGMWGLTAYVGIGQTAILIESRSGNLLFDAPGMIDDESVDAVRALGGIDAIATSHPHMFGAQSAWSAAFGDAPVWVSAADEAWLGLRPPTMQTWSEPFDVLPGITLDVIGGHFPGSAVAYRPRDANGRRSVLLSGDGVMVTPGGRVAFMRGYPTLIPLSAAVVRRIADRLSRYDTDVVWNNFGRRTRDYGSDVIAEDAQRHIDWVNGVFDHLT
ncbi:hydrolase [Tsukamurella sp. 8F]|uniref:hydrolase n=1 Tax=unclassified Tsukamurella TaxID=2633480 RepID=UPI0023B8FBCD|nr:MULTISPECIES: hydrolase [unclassified Tsukamurella]MDF0529706.1 hydrolase [Tsukamurella sp. 8J]MDF0585991.1 hydrolase [Tsukamurella sp. 8F]